MDDTSTELKRKAGELGIVLSGVNLEKEEDELFKLFGVEEDLAKRSKLRTLVRTERNQQQQHQKTLEDQLRELSFSPPNLPKLCTNLVARENAKTKIITYLKQCRDGVQDVKDSTGKFTLLGTSGVKGIGKTEIEGRICTSWATEALGDKAKALYVTYNGAGHSGDYCLQPERIGTNYGDAFGHLLLVACGVAEDIAVQVPVAKAIDLVIEKFGCVDSSLVICVDEIMELNRGEEYKSHQWSPAAHTMSHLMKLQDKKVGKLIFVFTGILDSMFTALKSLSGRAVQTLPLTLIPLHTVFSDLVSERLRHFINQPAVNQLIISCAGHPRATVDGLTRATRNWQQQEGVSTSDITTAEIAEARAIIVNQTCKFDLSYLNENILREWFDFRRPISPERREDLLSKGILHAVMNGHEKVEFLFPLLLQNWAKENQSSTFGYHLHRLFNADLVLAGDSEKSMEAVMFHYEALLRKATEGETFSLRSLYDTPHLAEALETKILTSIIAPDGASGVAYVDNFEDVEATIQKLTNGWILVSKKHSEVGVEYLVPYLSDHKLFVACVQCKFVQRSTSWAQIKDKMLTAVKGLKARGVAHFPVIYTTADQKKMMGPTHDDGAYFIETDLYNFTKRLGILRMHTMKLGANLLISHPYLRITE
jgi:hypothetical protein